jgi:hypothetical protein
MTKYQRACLDICRDAGLRPVGVEQRGKHWAVVCTEGRLFCASTPSDHRYFRNLRRSARRLRQRL